MFLELVVHGHSVCEPSLLQSRSGVPLSQCSLHAARPPHLSLFPQPLISIFQSPTTPNSTKGRLQYSPPRFDWSHADTLIVLPQNYGYPTHPTILPRIMPLAFVKVIAISLLAHEVTLEIIFISSMNLSMRPLQHQVIRFLVIICWFLPYTGNRGFTYFDSKSHIYCRHCTWEPVCSTIPSHISRQCDRPSVYILLRWGYPLHTIAFENTYIHYNENLQN